MERMNPKEIKTHPQFENLFPINDKVLEEIEKDMRAGTFDVSQMVILATWDGQSEPVCIDGHTRLRAAINVGIGTVPVFIHEFDSEDEALQKAINLQRNRRNMTDADIMVCVAVLDSRQIRGGDRRSEEAKSKASSDAIENAPSKSAAQTAELLGTSTSKVERCRTVMQNGDPETIEEVKQGKKSINRAATELREKRKGEAKSKAKTKKTEKKEIPNSPPVIKQAVSEKENTGNSDPESTTRLVKISQELFDELASMGKTVEYHVNRAIEEYLYDDYAEESVNEINTEVDEWGSEAEAYV
jgi:ParB family chromosome partitioning protein